MSDSLVQQIFHSDLEVACPACGYEIWVRYSEVVAQTAVLCPCCRVKIWLRDESGSAQMAGVSIENELRGALGGLWS